MADKNAQVNDIEVRFQVLHQFVDAARANLDDGAWDYLIGGAETETTQKRNRLALDRLAFRPRVMRDVNGLSAGTSFFRARPSVADHLGADRLVAAVLRRGWFRRFQGRW